MSKKKAFLCLYCDYKTNHKTKYSRHQKTLKHKIAQQGLECCGLIYYEKYKWVNHKKSKKHALNRDSPAVFLSDDSQDDDKYTINDLKMDSFSSTSSTDSYKSTATTPEIKRKKKKINLHKTKKRSELFS